MKFSILRSDIDAIIDDMGPTFDVKVFLYLPEDFNPTRETYFGIQIPRGHEPAFWVTVATWFCEVERTSIESVPEWTPMDLALAHRHVAVDQDVVYFEDFFLVEDY
jgi:hypothetical protein